MHGPNPSPEKHQFPAVNKLKGWGPGINNSQSKNDGNIQLSLQLNLTKVRPLYTLSHRGSDNSPLLIVFSANYIDQSIVTFM